MRVRVNERIPKYYAGTQRRPILIGPMGTMNCTRAFLERRSFTQLYYCVPFNKFGVNIKSPLIMAKDISFVEGNRAFSRG
jgi:hypothetical protein